jgi:hypothetical protein
MKDAGASELVMKIGALWRENKRREFLYLQALRKDSMGSLRQMLAKGHFSAVLFQKEINWIYDYFKCLLTDKDLDESMPDKYFQEGSFDDVQGKEQVASYLKNTEGEILLSYKALDKYVDRYADIKRIVDEHAHRITRFYELLSKQENAAVNG